ncbi:MAG: DUF2807 domain-containing protein [Bacteroidales bacterium]|nr:DUF2807 domain-containing protein [Bacteroidales bacterium]HOY37988.1 head GIN domain-containing protein [Bacteroidales bacterium]HQP04749.1 head GIN domain-containing protein [Bacteroidales bacterium]
MKRIVLISVTVALLAGMTACYFPHDYIRGVGQLTSIEKDTRGVNGIEINDIIDVVLVKSDTAKIIIEAQENIIDLVSTEVDNGICKVEFVRGYNVRPTLPVTVYIYTNIISSIEIDGSGDLTTNGIFDTLGNLEIDINGSGNVDFAWLEANDIYLEIDGSGDINVTGNGQNMSTTIDGSGNLHMGTELAGTSFRINGSGDIFISGWSASNILHIDGSGDFYGFDLETETTSVFIDGSGNAEVWATENLLVEIDGSGDVVYRGNPNINSGGSGSGNLINGN